MEYHFRQIEKSWQQKWADAKVYQVPNESDKPKMYVLDMFPYPSGAGLHVGHPLGYIASDIYSRYKRLQGYNVLHPMGFDAFGLPAEQYAIDHGIHPAISTAQNIENFKKQLHNIGFSYDWSREIRTCDPGYYKWTQWIFLKLFNAWFNRKSQLAENISSLIEIFKTSGNATVPFPNDRYRVSATGNAQFSAEEWEGFDETVRMEILMEYRLAYCGIGEVNWCEALGTVLANDEVVNGVSERGGHPVVRKKLRQWYLRITEYADRLLKGLETVDFTDAMKEMQSNWIGKSSGAEIDFDIKDHSGKQLKVYTTRPDTIFGVDFMVLAPEHALVSQVTTTGQQHMVDEYIHYVNSRSERERMAEKKITGVFTGAYALNPFDGREIPIWISEYVLAGYGTGAIMAVPSGDERDHKFARHFQIPITNIIGDHYNGEEANPTKDAILQNSGFLDGMVMKDAIEVVINKLEEKKIGVRKVNYKMRDAAFSRQRYWGEPFPVTWKNGTVYPLDESKLPVVLPEMDDIKAGKDGEGPLSNNMEWLTSDLFEGGRAESSTMPGYAGSSWYFLRYMDPHNDAMFCDPAISLYWGQVDLYIGGTEHAVGHLLYSRMWTKALYDLGYINFDEPFKRLMNQGMIQGSSRFVYRLSIKKKSQDEHEKPAFEFPVFFSLHWYEKYREGLLNQNEIQNLVAEHSDGITHWDVSVDGNVNLVMNPIRVDVNLVDGIELDMERFKNSKVELKQAIFITEGHDHKFICGAEVEKMSKSKYNTVNPDDIVEKYGADTFRMYEMFLGPIDQSKPWDTKGIEGVHRFLKKTWRLYMDDAKGLIVNTDEPTAAEWKVLHKTIKKIEEDTERFSFNTAVSSFMIAVNELTDLKCHKAAILQPLLVLLTPYAPHIAAELFQHMKPLVKGEVTDHVLDMPWPQFDEKYLVESSKEYPISINGKLRTTMVISLDATQPEVEEMVLANDVVQKWTEGKQPKKIIFVKNKMVNLVV